MSIKPKSLKTLNFKPFCRVFPSPNDWRDQFIYHLLIDRFNSTGPDIPPYDPALVPRLRCDTDGDKWQGGNLIGIRNRLDYISGLGCTALWVTPIFKNRKEMDTFHGYAVQNFLDVDPRFGTLKDFQCLVREAHERSMYIILDIVLGYTGDNWTYPDGYPFYIEGKKYPFGSWRLADPTRGIQWPDDAIWPLEFQNPEWYMRNGEIRDWTSYPENMVSDFISMKKLDTSNPEVVKALIDVYRYWIAVSDVDGYCIDAAKHIEEPSIARISSAIREYAYSIGKKNFLICGEIYGGDELIERYLRCKGSSSCIRKDFQSINAVLDYPLRETLEWVIKGYINPKELIERYEHLNKTWHDIEWIGHHFVTFADDHNVKDSSMIGRFLYNNRFYKQVILAIGYLLTSKGIPRIYYGTEQGFDGGGKDNLYPDKYKRECMFGGKWGAFNTTGHHFFNPKNPIYQEISHIAKIRKQEPALRYGRQYFRAISGNGVDFGYPIDGKCTLAYSRILDDTEILIAMNLDSKPRIELVTVDYNLSPAQKEMVNLLGPEKSYVVNLIGDRHAVRIPLDCHEMAILKLR
ncbi:MAG: alpha-amylase family glycosyl hydrolase [Methanothrix sp.]|nr:alpha-amylase family glycosyl hydrolase [Methanothrix sp.]